MDPTLKLNLENLDFSISLLKDAVKDYLEKQDETNEKELLDDIGRAMLFIHLVNKDLFTKEQVKDNLQFWYDLFSVKPEIINHKITV